MGGGQQRQADMSPTVTAENVTGREVPGSSWEVSLAPVVRDGPLEGLIFEQRTER